MSLTNIDNKLLLFGGSGPAAQFYDDIIIFDPDYCEWHFPRELSGKQQTQRSGHTSNFGDGKIFVIGTNYNLEQFINLLILSYYTNRR